MPDYGARILIKRASLVFAIFGVPAAAIVIYIKLYNPDAPPWLPFLTLIGSWILFIIYYRSIAKSPKKQP